MKNKPPQTEKQSWLSILYENYMNDKPLSVNGIHKNIQKSSYLFHFQNTFPR
ncbi:replication protein [Pediococcus acidilactici]|nr:replication protein [Pediococcus acidilactici]KAF0391578.1 replication protein [Pediococcus acidilactici]KAF0491617.1 replication protein [Pediococcus acidilactici]